MNVRVIKLISGIELIGEVLTDSQTELKVRRPLVVQIFRQPDGSAGLNFMQWSLISDDEIVYFNPEALACKTLSASEEIAKTYIQNVTGIEVPVANSGKILMG